MKKLIQASMFLFSIGVFLLASEISCKKSIGQTTSSTTQGIILYGKNVQVPGSNTDSVGNPILVWSYQFMVANIDGTNPRQIPISLPSGFSIGQGGYLTSNGQTLVFTAQNTIGTRYIYSCNLNGSNVKQLINIDSNTQLLGVN